mmetsp:Transcript_24665/g.21893  ORF Transcript_24665/g.21893 Transcript_24665/m.21893 type:complete len:475 (+) Transcript_24665:15-1439(+)
MSLLSVDIYFFILWSYIFYKINKGYSIAVYLVKDCVAFFPPMEEDKEYIKEDKDQKKEDNKKDNGQFPIRTFKPDLELTKHVKEFLVEYDFTVLLSLILIMTYLTSMIFKIFVPSDNNSSFIFYSMSILLVLTVYYKIKHNTFPYDLSDENKILIMFAFKAFIFSYMITGYFTEYFDFQLERGIQELQVRTDQILKVTGNRYRYSNDTFYIALSVASAFLSITVVHLAVKFAYNFYFLNKTANDPDIEEDMETAGRVQRYRILMTINFFTPLIAIFLYIPALSRSMVVPDIMTNEGFDVFRITFLLITILLKGSVFLYEVQFSFNESYFYVQSLLKNKSEKLFDYITLKIKLKFINTWVTCFKYLGIILIPLFLTLLHMYKYFEANRFPEKVEYDFSAYQATLEKSEFVENAEPMGSLTDSKFFIEVFKQIAVKGLIPARLQADILNYLIFSFYLSWFFVSTIGLLYYRKFKTA